jgi:nicotinate-nucleotide pyrophosphorylase (carboxylating)
MSRDPLPTADRAPSLDEGFARQEVRRFLAEDIGGGDVTTLWTVPDSATATGWIVAREACVVAGLPLARLVFHEVGAGIDVSDVAKDGDAVAAGSRLMRLAGRARPMLSGERLALNLLQRLSGVATVTRRYAEALAGTSASVSDTRKTTPGLRVFEKYAVRVGGGRNHRIGLFDAVLIKDNHIAASGGITPALRAVASHRSGNVPVQIEVDGLDQLTEALDCGVDAVLLDNMSPARVREAVALIRGHANGATCWIEASGGITLTNIRAYAEAGADTVSVGALTHSAPSVDIALDFE